MGADDWCPFSCNSPITEKPGIVTEIVKEAFASAGFELDYRYLSWARAIKLAEQDQLSGLLGAYLADLPNFITTKNPIIRSRDCFFVNNDDVWKYQDSQSLTSRKIGIIKDYTYGETIEKMKKQKANKVFFESTGEDALNQNIKKLELKRLDTLLENEMVIGYLKSQGKLPAFKSVGCLEKKDIYVVFNPKNPKNKDYVKVVDQFLEKNTDRIKAITDKYVTGKSKN